jgi:hypothetical protein
MKSRTLIYVTAIALLAVREDLFLPRALPQHLPPPFLGATAR